MKPCSDNDVSADAPPPVDRNQRLSEQDFVVQAQSMANNCDTPLMLDRLNALLVDGADLYAVNAQGVSALGKSAAHGHAACESALLHAGATSSSLLRGRPMMRSSRHTTPLMRACAVGGDLSGLHDGGADINAVR